MDMKMLFFKFLFLLTVSSFGQMPNTISASDKVYGLSKFWQEVNYNFVYLDKVDRQMWDNRYKELITTVQNTKNDYEYYRELQKFCALLKDGHTNVYFPENMPEFNSMFGDYRLVLENIDGKAIITRTNLSKKKEIPCGSEIIEVNGMPTQKYIDENVAPYISSSTDYILKDWGITKMLTGVEGQTYTVKIRKPNKQITELKLTHKRTEEKELYPPYTPYGKLMDFKWVNKQTAYVALNSFEDRKIDSLFIAKLPELYRAKALIIDLRNNGGGSTDIGEAIFQYLTNDKVIYGSKQSSRLHIPAYKAWGKFVDVKDIEKHEWYKKSYLTFHDKSYYDFDYAPDTLKVDAKRIVVPTVLLIGHHTGSAAEDFLIYADNQKHMIKIGENTFGSTGQPYQFDMPGGGSARVCTKKDTYPDGREFVGYGIKPDIEVKMKLKDFLEGKDPALEKAIEKLKELL